MQQIFQSRRWQLISHDAFLLGIMMVLAACGLIYEYLLSHYAGRVLGVMESTIYAMIGLMIVAMGLGAWAAKWFKSPYSVFAWLEATIALIGCTATLVIAGAIALTGRLPELISSAYNLPPDTVISGGVFEQLQVISRYLPYFAGFVLGLFIGMEIPLIARVREDVYGQHLENNVGTIYGADYIGAGFGAVIWITLMLSMDITVAAIWTALFNVLAGFLFLWRYWKKIKFPKALAALHVGLLALLIVIADSGARWMSDFSNVLYRDRVVYQTQTRFQNITFTQRSFGSRQQPVIDMYLNGRLQFSSFDETIYHAMLTYPALLASARQDNVLVIGGGDGLAVRDILKWEPESVTLIDLDEGLVELFSERFAQSRDEESEILREKLLELNESAFEDPRVNVIFGDAFVELDKLLEQQVYYDTIIIDLPDPSHPDLNKLYSDHFYARISKLLVGDGVLVVQSTSPFHAKNAFISIGKTVEYAGFTNVEQYRQNVPSFGEWGWTIATKMGQSAKQRIQNHTRLPVESSYINKDILMAAFAMPNDFYRGADDVSVNILGTGTIYQYHTQAWQKDVGVYSSGQ
ncbi:polyamine aminopropyltransferase [Pleionea sediminis]|uniref:polyamine aminopropyltransferase n=1 Tax=Pleionea sediminis TaxID=2569479 RepID=UPI001186A92F|nr:polyamine aminopropyltransferase [Pleionea sediminis]